MKPEWLTIVPQFTEKYKKVKDTVSSLGLHTVCTEAKCPNVAECWGSGTATFMVLGDRCTRSCKFCSVMKSVNGIEVDRKEPAKLAKAIKDWGLDYVVITSVCRDDLEDQGASHFAECVKSIKEENPDVIVEVLIPDFQGDPSLVKKIAYSRPDVIGHNIETVERLNPKIRDRRASYTQSIDVLKSVKEADSRIYTKSAMMLGLGEEEDEVIRSMHDLNGVGVDFLAIGQYLKPVSAGFYIDVKDYITPERFEYFKELALEIGFLYVAAGPFVRSSYKAGEFFTKSLIKR